MSENDSIFGIDQDFDGNVDKYDDYLTWTQYQEDLKFWEEQEKEKNKNKLNIEPTYSDNVSTIMDKVLVVIGTVVLIIPLLMVIFYICS